MTSQKVNKLERKFGLIGKKFSLMHQKLKNNLHRFSPFFLLFLVMFTNLWVASPAMRIGEAVHSKNDSKLQLASAVELTLLNKYPSDDYVRVLGLALEDDYLFSIIGYNPTIFDVSNASNPTFISEYIYPTGRLTTLTFRNEYLYLGSLYGLEILDVSNHTNISKVGVYNTTISDHVWAITLQDDYAYLAAENNGLVIVNISDPTQPKEVGCYNTSLCAYDVVVAGDYAFIANGNETGNALVILDVSDPLQPIEISHYEDVVYTEMPGFGISVNGSYAYLGTSGYGLFILDISDIYHPVKLSQFYGGTDSMGDWSDETVKDIFVYGKYIFEAAGDNGVYILDVSDPLNPFLVGGDKRPYTFDVCLQGTYLYVGDIFYGLLVFQVTFPSTTGRPVGQIIAMILVPSLGVVIITTIVILYKRKKISSN
ncbi:MAG TPA: hypothetical protein VMZ29_08430 [Candidatus Bathyarchaeia archaeon]|nr:hypothetical protein [Candidatus Bathyarchaeia archaeon]